MARTSSAVSLVKRCLREDLRIFRSRLFVGLANLLPDFNTVATLVRPWLLQLAGARVEFPCTIHSPLFVYDAGKLSIERYAFINQGCRLEGRKPIRIGRGALIGPFCCIENVNHRPEGSEELPVTIEPGSWIGARCVLLPGCTVGPGAVIGAGSVVRGSVPGGQLWAGVPASFRRRLSESSGEARSNHPRGGRTSELPTSDLEDGNPHIEGEKSSTMEDGSTAG